MRMQLSPMNLDQLVGEAWRIYHQAAATTNGVLVRPSIPILFFGDSDRYYRSPRRIITVGLNPSLQEFPPNSRFSRFPLAKDLYPRILTGEATSEYLAALNSYFRIEPYRSWFDSYEPLLNGMGASFYDGAEGTALHTDICSPLATDPTWSRLGSGSRSALILAGRALWHKLVRLLEPDFITSVARGHLVNISFRQLDEWRVFHTVERANPFYVKAVDLEVLPGKPSTLIFGQAAQLPFGTVSRADKHRIGVGIRKLVDGR
jgi:hypothetical protein